MKNRKTPDKRNLAPDEREKQAEEALRESERQLSVLMSNLPGLVFRCQIAPEWTMEFISEGCLELTGYHPHEFIGDGVVSFGSIIHPDDRSHVWDTIQAVANQASPYEVEYRIITKEKKEKWVWERGRCVSSQAVEPAILEGYICDITARKKAEAEREEALLRAEAVSHAKSEFLAVMSHELRTPLNGVLGFAGLLSDTPLNDEQKSFVQTISSSGEHLLSLVNDILDYASMEHGALKIVEAPFALAGLVDISRQTVTTIAAEKGIGLRSEIAPGVPEQILGDERRIRQILINLLHNAVKFSSASHSQRAGSRPSSRHPDSAPCARRST